LTSASTTRFALLVQEKHWDSYEKFCIHFAKAAARAAEKEGDLRLSRVVVSRSTFDRWMGRKGVIKGTPRREAYLVLRHMFNMSVERLFQHVDPRALAPATVGTGTTGLAPALTLASFDDPMAVVAQTHRLTATNADTPVLTMVTQTIASIVTRYEALGPQHLAGEARVVREMLHGMLAGQQPPRVRAELFRLASQAAGLLGYMAVNAGARFDVVDAYCTEAEKLAREVGEVSMEMWASGTRSLGLYYHKRYLEADDAAAAGIALAPDNAQAVRLLVNGRSRALARLGDRSGAEQAIGQAFELSDRQPSLPDGLTSCISFEPYSMARTLANAVTTRLSLGDTAEVLTHAEQIEDLVEQSDSEWSRALVGLDVASALLKQTSPEVEHAMALGRRALRAGTTPPIKSVWERATELYESAERWHEEPDVGDYAEELRAWRSQPQAEMITVGSHAHIAP
jgi:tetratricopeptide (TPR) repeat protein